MTVEDPFITADKRSSVLSSISSMSDKDQRKYSHIWMAERSDGRAMVQFDGRGNELNYGKVKKGLNNSNVKAVYFVPVEADGLCYGVKTGDVNGDVGLLRRGYKKINQSTGAVVDSGYVCRIEAGDKYLYFDGNGNCKVSSDEDLNVKTEVVDQQETEA